MDTIDKSIIDILKPGSDSSSKDSSVLGTLIDILIDMGKPRPPWMI